MNKPITPEQLKGAEIPESIAEVFHQQENTTQQVSELIPSPNEKKRNSHTTTSNKKAIILLQKELSRKQKMLDTWIIAGTNRKLTAKVERKLEKRIAEIETELTHHEGGEYLYAENHNDTIQKKAEEWAITAKVTQLAKKVEYFHQSHVDTEAKNATIKGRVSNFFKKITWQYKPANYDQKFQQALDTLNQFTKAKVPLRSQDETNNLNNIDEVRGLLKSLQEVNSWSQSKNPETNENGDIPTNMALVTTAKEEGHNTDSIEKPDNTLEDKTADRMLKLIDMALLNYEENNEEHTSTVGMINKLIKIH